MRLPSPVNPLRRLRQRLQRGPTPPPGWRAPQPSFALARRREPFFDVAVAAMAGWVACRYDLRVVGLGYIPRTGPVILAPNHVSLEDPVVLGVLARRAGRRARAVAIQSLFARPVLGRILRATRQIPIDRDRSRPALHSAAAALKAGEAVLLYPEGQVARGQPSQPRVGVAILALTTGAPVVPITSVGLEARQPGDPWRRRAAVVVGPPVDLARWRANPGRGAAREAAAAVYGAIVAQRPAAAAFAGGPG